jgi:hypothetical protein
MDDNPLVVLEQTDKDLAIQFLECLGKYAAITIKTVMMVNSNDDNIHHHPQQPQQQQHQLFVLESMLKLLVQLTSLTNKSSRSLSNRNEQPLEEESYSDYYGNRPTTWSELITTSSISFATFESSTTATTTWPHLLVQALTTSCNSDNHYSNSHNHIAELTCIILGNLVGDGTHRIPNEVKPTMIAGLIQAVMVTPTTSVAAAWALTNMIRNDTTSLASTYCTETLLSTPLLLTWLRHPPIATQTAWMIASLTTREEEVVMYLCRNLSFLSSLVQAVAHPVASDQMVPLLQTLGNLACHASLVPALLSQTDPPLIPLLQQLLSQASSSSSPSSSSRDSRSDPRLLTLAAWLAGCLLVDVGVENHPSTTVAAPALIPTLIHRLGGGDVGEFMVAENGMTMEEEREFVSALWNALAFPPGLDHVEQQVLVKLPFVFDVPRSSLRAMIRLVSTNDADAVVASVNVLNLLLRRQEIDSPMQFHNLLNLMHEEELPDALERICDSPLEEAAEVAADLLDDYFYNDEQEDEPTNNPPVGFSWMPPATAENSSAPVPMLGMNVGNEPTRGLGRGRGATLPAWMSKS